MTDSEPYVFLSYRSIEVDFATRLRDNLQKNGIHIWMDNLGGIQGGDNWRDTVEQAIDSARVLIPVISPEYLKSRWCRNELNRADTNNIPIIPVYFKQVDKFPIVIDSIQYVDFREVSSPEVYSAKMTELIAQIREKIGIEVSSSPVVATPLSRQILTKKRVHLEARVLYMLIVLVVIPVSLLVGIAVVGPERVQSWLTSLQNLLDPSLSAVLHPSVEEFSLAVEQDSLYRHLEGISSPHGLVAAPTRTGNAIWGYGAANHTLFAVDAGTGNSLQFADGKTILSLSEHFGDNFLPSAMQYDGAWLWIGDARNDQIVALNPLSPESDPPVIYALEGNPVSITSTGSIIWLALQDANTVSALTVNHASQTVEPHCQTNSGMFDSPHLLVAEQQIAIWVASGRGTHSQLSRISTQSCRRSQQFQFSDTVDSMSWSQGTLWIVSGGKLYQWDENMSQPQLIALPSDHAIVEAITVQNDVWLATDNHQILHFQPQSGKVNIQLWHDAIINSMIGTGRQVWVAREDNTLSRYLKPDFVYPELAGMAWGIDGLLVIDKDNKLCNIKAESLNCYTISTDGEPATMAASANGEMMWIGYTNNRVLYVNPQDGSIAQTLAVTGISIPKSITSVSSELWISDLISGTVVIDLNTEKQTLLESMNVAAPSALDYDGSSIWFADNLQRSFFTITRDGSILRQQTTFELPTTISKLVATGEEVTVFASGTAYTLSSLTGDTEGMFGIGTRIDDVAEAGDAIWIADRSSGFIYRVTTGG